MDSRPDRACSVVYKLIHQAADSAKRQHEMTPESLFVATAMADGAGIMKRHRAMSMGRAGVIRKRLSHVLIEIQDRPVKVSPKPLASETPVKNKKRKLVGAAK